MTHDCMSSCARPKHHATPCPTNPPGGSDILMLCAPTWEAGNLSPWCARSLRLPAPLTPRAPLPARPSAPQAALTSSCSARQRERRAGLPRCCGSVPRMCTWPCQSPSPQSCRACSLWRRTRTPGRWPPSRCGPGRVGFLACLGVGTQHPRTHTHTHVYTYFICQACTYTLTNTRAPTQIHTLSLSHNNTHIRTNTHMHTHAGRQRCARRPRQPHHWMQATPGVSLHFCVPQRRGGCV